MNPHHLELFYFVAKFQGITEAVRKMPYGIQQPAVSGQILQLEDHLGVKLFRRRPFALTPAGEELFEFIEPFFSKLDLMAQRLSGEESQHLRLAASASALTHHLPEVLQSLRDEHPGLRLSLRELNPSEVESALVKQEADVAIAVLHRKAAAGIKTRKLLDIPLTLLAPVSCPVNHFKDILNGSIGGHIQEPLVALPGIEAAARVFQTGLSQRNLSWEATMEVSEISLIQKYVEKGFGFGIAVDIPGVTWPDTVKQIKLPKGFPKLSLGILYSGELKPVASRFVALTEAYAENLSKLSK
ncbi:MAG: LysR family transcriptional regulator [Verrucomicrobiales bacterium]|nr:LysR family transcriptional regulator [Verrucomicrobiales bacterium]